MMMSYMLKARLSNWGGGNTEDTPIRPQCSLPAVDFDFLQQRATAAPAAGQENGMWAGPLKLNLFAMCVRQPRQAIKLNNLMLGKAHKRTL